VNGISLINPSKMTVPTDRGAFFDTGDKTITFPPNSVSPSFSLPKEFTMTFWTLVKDYSFYVIFLRSSSGFLYLRRLLIDEVLNFRVKTEEYDTGEQTNKLVKYSDQTWMMTTFSVGKEVRLYLNSDLLISYTLEKEFNAIEITEFNLGIKDDLTSFTGLAYNFIIFNEIRDFTGLLGSASSNCLKGTCEPCSFSIIESEVQGCLSKLLKTTYDSSGNFCFGCTESCSDNICLSCDKCKEKTCVIDENAVFCKCPSTAKASPVTCSCESQEFFDGENCQPCLPECKKCFNSTHCTSCLTQNSSLINGKCKCDDGFYNISSLSSENSCISCGKNCKKCGESGNCKLCKDPNANISNNCECNSGFFQSKTTCKSCYFECEECEDFLSCKTCISEFALPAGFGCKCLEGFGGQKPLVLKDSCRACHSDCETCTEAGICESCKFENSVAGKEGCDCAEGFYKKDQQCIACQPGCKSCNETTCLKCLDEFAQVKKDSCYCPDGFFEDFGSDSGNYTACRRCHDSCKTCNNSNSCIECYTQGAVIAKRGCSCPDRFTQIGLKCVECLTWNSLTGTCVFCDRNQYFSNLSCFNCPDLCLRCNQEKCFECKKNAFLNKDFCECETYYQGKSECLERNFFVKVELVERDMILVNFSLPLKEKLSPGNFEIRVKGSLVASLLKNEGADSYSIQFEILEELHYSTEVVLKFMENVLSVINSTLEENTFSFKLSPLKVDEKEAKKQEIKLQAKSTLYITFTITVLLSLMNWNFVSIWSFINIIQILLCLLFIDVKLPFEFQYTLIALNESVKIFNIFELFLKKESFPEMRTSWKHSGLSSVSFLLNFGHLVTIFILIIVSFIVSYFFKKLSMFRPFSYEFIKKRIENYNKSFFYDEFLRFYIQFYINMGIGSFVGTIYGQWENLSQVFDFIISLSLMGLTMMTPLLTLLFINKRKNLVLAHNEYILEHYGSLFYEFAFDKSLLITFFYFFYFTRRAFICLVLIFL
jgi:hypothetical protein